MPSYPCDNLFNINGYVTRTSTLPTGRGKRQDRNLFTIQFSTFLEPKDELATLAVLTEPTDPITNLTATRPDILG